MSKPFVHFVITRFNIFSGSGWDALQKRLDEAYLTYRFELFERYCLPSFVAQLNQQFLWLLLLDADTPERFKTQMAAYSNQYHNVFPLYIEAGTTLVPTLVKAIRQLAPDEPTHLLTTRVDNDDAVSDQFIDQIQAQFNYQTNTFIYFKHGYMWREPKLYARTYETNPFATRILEVDWSLPNLSPIDDNPTVYVGQHGQLIKLGNSVIVDNRSRVWLQVLHGNNVGNYLPPHCIRQPVSELYDGFAFLHGTGVFAKEESKASVLIEQLLAKMISMVWQFPMVRNMKRQIFNRGLM